MAPRKARNLATAKANREAHVGSQAGKLKSREATPAQIPMSMLAIYAGRTCLGHVILRGRSGVEAFDADDQSLGIYPNLKSAADAISIARTS